MAPVPTLRTPAARPNNVLRGSIVTLLYRVTGTIFGMLVSVITARALNVSDLGVYYSTIVVVQAMGAVAASFASSTGFFVSKRGRPAGEVASNSLILSLMLGGTLFLVSLVIVFFYRGDQQAAILLAGFALLPIIARTALGGVSLGTHSLWPYNFSIHGPNYVNVVLLIGWVTLLKDHSSTGALITWVIAQYVSLFALAAMNRDWWGWLTTHRPDPALMRALISFGAVIGIAGFISYFNYRIDLLLVTWLDSTEGAGIYSRAVTLAEALWLVSTSIAIAGFASVGSLSRHEAAILTATGVRHTLLIVSLGAIATFIAAPYLIEILFGSRYTAGTESLRILCVGTALFAPQSILANYFTVQMARPSLSMAVAGTSCVLNVVVSTLLIPRFGYVGGAWATTISYAAVGVLSVAIFLRNSDVHFNDLWRIRGTDLRAYIRLFQSIREHPAFARLLRTGHGA